MMKRSCCSPIWLGLFMVCLIGGIGRAQISSYGVEKSAYYTQTSDAAPALESGENHYFSAFVEPDGTTDIDSAILQTPAGAQVEMAPFLFYFDGFTSQTALDNRFGNGTY